MQVPEVIMATLVLETVIENLCHPVAKNVVPFPPGDTRNRGLRQPIKRDAIMVSVQQAELINEFMSGLMGDLSTFSWNNSCSAPHHQF